jgi:TonB-dependent SusC/RagA subfamily outer membrane receptor
MRLRIIIILTLFVGLTSLPLAAQKSSKKIVITGKVVDADKNPMPGVYILVDNKNVDCQTDQKGLYKVKVSPAAKYITAFSMTNGMKDIPIEGKTVINVELFSANAVPIVEQKKEKEETVDVGYGTMKKKDLTSTVNNSKAEGQHNRFSSYNNIYDLIRNEVPGVRGTGSNIFLVEPSSLMLSNEPLYVVDGTPVSSLEGISPNMVKSVSALKGSSASIYGSRGANGVFLINLIKGNEKK